MYPSPDRSPPSAVNNIKDLQHEKNVMLCGTHIVMFLRG